MKKIALVLILCIAVGLSPAAVLGFSSNPEIVGESAVLIDATTGEILFEKDMNGSFEPASTTKILTCLLALENLPLDQVLVIDPVSPFAGGSKIFIIEDEELTVEQLLYALMLYSANDAAEALAIAISGSIEGFAALMNERARELGALGTNFINPSGLHAPGHVSTAYDLAMITKEAMKNPDFRQLVSTIRYTIPETNKQPDREYIYNTNRLLWDDDTRVSVRGIMTPTKYTGVTGVKTGFTPQAGASLVSSARRDGTELIAVVLASTELGRFGDSIGLLDYGFDNFFTYKAVDSGDIHLEDVRVSRGAVSYVPVEINEDKYITLPKEASLSLVTTELVLDEIIVAPVSTGQQLGKLLIYEGPEIIGEIPVFASSDVAEGMFLSRFGIEDRVSASLIKWGSIIGGVLFLLVLAYLALLIRYKIRRKALREKKARQIAMERQRLHSDRRQREWPY